MNRSVRRILESTEYCTIATVCEDGTPWNVPVRFAFDTEYLYFRSPTGTMHGSNIEKDGRISVSIFDTSQSVKGAVYLHSLAERLDGPELAVAKQVFDDRFDNPPDQWDKTDYFRVALGEPDTARTTGEMYYYHAGMSNE